MIVVAAPQVVVDQGTVSAFAFAAEISPTAAFSLGMVGVDGSVWDLTHGSVQVLGGVTAFAAPDVSHWWKTSPALDGSRWDGMRTASSDVILPVVTLGDDWAGWRDTDAAFFRAIHPGGEALFTVMAPDGVTRTRGLRFVSGGGVEDIDPLTQLCSAYTLEFTAANPFWRGDPVAARIEVKDPVPLFPGPPFDINRSSSSTDGSQVTNPGDEPAWPLVRVTGPATSWAVSIGDASVSSDTPLLAGQSVEIDMANLTVLDENGVNVYGNLDDDTFAPIPPGVDVPLDLEFDGYGTGSLLEVSFVPLYRRPW